MKLYKTITAWKLTNAEQKKKTEVESVGGIYWIVEDEDDALKMAYYSHA